jgi:deoxyribonuclease-4
MRLGLHISIAGHIYESITRAQELGCNTMQIFSRDPRQWRRGRLSLEDIEEFRRRRQKSKLAPVFVHIPYPLNLASGYSVLYRDSIRAYIDDILEVQALGADYIVTHMGSHKKSTEEKGLKRFISALNRILDRTKKSPVAILLENTSGSGSWLGYKFEHQQQVINAVEQKNRLGVCFDTCHGYSAGYDLATAEGLNQALGQLDKTVGLCRLKLIHLNDTKDKFASRRDRHEHIGKGEIGLGGFSRIVNDRRLKDIPFILETPKDSDEADKMNLTIVRKLANS